MLEAAKYQVFPLDNSLATRMATPRPSVTAGRTRFTYSGELTGVPMGFATLAFNNMSGVGRPGTGVLKVDGQVVATQRMERTLPLTLQWDETFDVGADTGTPVDDKDYQVPFKFTGKLNKLTIAVDRPK